MKLLASRDVPYISFKSSINEKMRLFDTRGHTFWTKSKCGDRSDDNPKRKKYPPERLGSFIRHSTNPTNVTSLQPNRASGLSITAMAHEEALVLLDSLISPFGQRVRIALAEKGVDYEYKVEDLKNKSEFLLKSNPVYKQIPVLIHNGNPICQSLIIVQYIDEVWSDKAPLLPTEPYARANAHFWADFVDKKVYECGSKLWKQKGEHHETAKQWVEIFKLLEGELGDKKFFGDDAFGYVDITLVPFIVFFYAFEQCAKLSMEEECPKIVAWAKRCMERESVSKALSDPKMIYDMILSM